LNSDKTNGRGDLEIKVNNYVIESVEYQNVLGVIVDKTLS